MDGRIRAGGFFSSLDNGYLFAAELSAWCFSYQEPAYFFPGVAQLVVGGEDEKDMRSRHCSLAFWFCSFLSTSYQDFWSRLGWVSGTERRMEGGCIRFLYPFLWLKST